MKVAFLTTDNREHCREYNLEIPYFGTAPEAVLQGFATLPEIEVHVVSCTQRPMKSPVKLADNIFFHSLHVPKIGWMRTGYQGCVRAVRKYLKDLQPDIVHGQGTERDCGISAVFSGFPNVLTIHGNMAQLANLFKATVGTFHWLAGKLEDFTLPRTAGVFCNSAYTEALVAARGCKTWRVPNALREQFFAETQHQCCSSATLLNIGVVTPRKRQLEVLRMMGPILGKHSEASVHFIGKAAPADPYCAQFLSALQEKCDNGRMSHSGFKTTSELIANMDAAGALIHFPSEEAFGLVVAEALARNLKIFASDLGGISEIAKGVEGVELFAANDWRGLEEAVCRWLEKDAPKPTTAAEAMRERYHPNVVARRHVEIYREVLRTSV